MESGRKSLDDKVRCLTVCRETESDQKSFIRMADVPAGIKRREPMGV